MSLTITEKIQSKSRGPLDINTSLDFLFHEEHDNLDNEFIDTSPKSDHSSSMASFPHNLELSPEMYDFLNDVSGQADPLKSVDIPETIDDFDLNNFNMESLNDVGDFNLDDLLGLGSIEAYQSPDDIVHLNQEIIEAPEHVIETSGSWQTNILHQQHSGDFSITFSETSSEEPTQQSRSNVGPIRSNGRRSKQRSISSLPYTVHDVEPESLALHNEDLETGKPGEPIYLTAEECQHFVSEGMSVPTLFPLTKTEERALKTVRRMIRNRHSAKASRAKKQGYVQGLEVRVAECTKENSQLKKQMGRMKEENGSLLNQLNALRTLVRRYMPSTEQMKHPIAGTSLLALMLTFAVVLSPEYSPFLNNQNGGIVMPSHLPGRNRALLQEKELSTDLGQPYDITIRPGQPFQYPPQTPAVILPKVSSQIPKYATTSTLPDMLASVLEPTTDEVNSSLMVDVTNFEAPLLQSTEVAMSAGSGENNGRIENKNFII